MRLAAVQPSCKRHQRVALPLFRVLPPCKVLPGLLNSCLHPHLPRHPPDPSMRPGATATSIYAQLPAYTHLGGVLAGRVLPPGADCIQLVLVPGNLVLNAGAAARRLLVQHGIAGEGAVPADAVNLRAQTARWLKLGAWDRAWLHVEAGHPNGQHRRLWRSGGALNNSCRC